MVTILDVAREAKVAPSTVSLVVNNNDWVSDEMRARVQEVVERLGYRPRRQRRSASPATTTGSTAAAPNGSSHFHASGPLAARHGLEP